MLDALLFLVLAGPTPSNDLSVLTERDASKDSVAFSTRLEPHFTPNEGQWPAAVLYRTRLDSAAIWVTRDGFASEVRSPNARLGLVTTFEGANPSAHAEGEAPLVGRESYFLGADSGAWATGLATFGRVRLRSLYEGIDLLLRTEERRLEYDLHLQPGADLEQVVVRVDGAKHLHVDEAGALCMETDLGCVRQTPPRTWVVVDGAPVAIESGFRVLDESRYTFWVEPHDDQLALSIDPGLE